MKKQLFLLLLILPLFLGCSKDEVDVMGDVYGKIIDSETGNPIYGAEIILKPGNRTVVSGNDGAYEFVELEAGQYNISVTASDYDFNSRYVEVLPGERVACDILMTKSSEIYDLEITPEVLDFGTVLTEKSLKIKNIGTTPTDWSLNLGSNRMWLSADPEMGNIAGGKTQTITFSIDRSLISSEKNVTAHLIAFGNSYPISIVCNHEVAKGSLQISKSTLDFGTDLEELTFKISNIGNASIKWSIDLVPSYLTFSDTSGTLSAGASKIVTVRIDRDEILTDVNTNIVITDGNNDLSLLVTAPKTAGSLQVSKSLLDFGTDLDDISLTLSNTGNGSLQWRVKDLPSCITSSLTSGTLLPGGKKIVTLSLDRDAVTSDINRTIIFSDGENEIPVTVIAAKSEGKLQISKNLLDFGTDTEELSITLSNIGNGSLQWEVKDLPSYISFSESIGSLLPGGSKIVKVRVNRDAISASINRSLIITDGKSDISLSIMVTKVQKWAEMVIYPKTLSFGETLSTKTFTIENVGNANLSWNVDGSIPSYMNVTPKSGSVAPNSSSLVTVTLNRSTMPTTINTSISVSDGSNTQTIQVNATNPIVEDYSSATIVSCDYRVEAKIISCKRYGSQVVFTYRLKNVGLGDVRDFRIYPPSSFSLISGGYRSVITDNLDNTYPYAGIKFGTENIPGSSYQQVLASEFYQDVPYTGEVTLSGVPESATEITVMLGVFVYNHTPDILSRKLYFKNVPIF